MRKEDIKYVIQACALLCAVGYVFYNSFIPILVLSPFIYFYVKQSRIEKRKKEEKQLAQAFKDGIVAVSVSLNVGYSIENAFKEATKEMEMLYGKESRISKEFRHICNRISQNDNIEDILEDFGAKSKVEDITYFAEVFKFAKRSGGDLIAIAKHTASVISDKNEVAREIETVISGKKMEQRVMNVIPFAIILYLRITSPEFVNPLYGNVVGIVVMTICLAVYVGAVILSSKIVDINI